MGKKSCGELNSLETISYLILSSQLQKCIVTIPNPFDPNCGLDLYINLKSNTKNNCELVDFSPYIIKTVSLEAAIIGGSENNFNFSSKENLKMVEDATEKYFQDTLTSFLYKISKEYNSDILLLGNGLRRKYLTIDEWNNVHWKEIFKKSFFKVNVSVDVTASSLFMKD